MKILKKLQESNERTDHLENDGGKQNKQKRQNIMRPEKSRKETKESCLLESLEIELKIMAPRIFQKKDSKDLLLQKLKTSNIIKIS